MKYLAAIIAIAAGVIAFYWDEIQADQKRHDKEMAERQEMAHIYRMEILKQAEFTGIIRGNTSDEYFASKDGHLYQVYFDGYGIRNVFDKSRK